MNYIAIIDALEQLGPMEDRRYIDTMHAIAIECQRRANACEDKRRQIPEGFHLTGTGGGCTAWTYEFVRGHAMITDADGPSAPNVDQPDAPCVLGVYGDNTDKCVLFDVPALRYLLAALKKDSVLIRQCESLAEELTSTLREDIRTELGAAISTYSK